MEVVENKMYECICGCSVSKFSREKIQPLVREMDEKGHMPDHLIKDLFANGVMIVIFYNC